MEHTTIKNWAIKKVMIGELIPNGKNPRTITEAKLNKLKKQIEEVGFNNPLIIDENNIILGGNQRYQALKQLYGNTYEVYVRYPTFKLTDKQKDEIVITDNISDGDWDFDMLANEWETPELIEWGLELPNTDIQVEDTDEEFEEDLGTEKKLLKCPCCGHINEEKAFKNISGGINEDTE